MSLPYDTNYPDQLKKYANSSKLALAAMEGEQQIYLSSWTKEGDKVSIYVNSVGYRAMVSYAEAADGSDETRDPCDRAEYTQRAIDFDTICEVPIAALKNRKTPVEIQFMNGNTVAETIRFNTNKSSGGEQVIKLIIPPK